MRPRTVLPLVRSFARALVAAATLALVGCSWSMPADPGMNARSRSATLASDVIPPAGDATRGPSPARVLGAGMPDDGARAIYLQRCSVCHEPFSPRHASADAWPSLVRKYGPRAGLFGEERARVLAWLQSNAR